MSIEDPLEIHQRQPIVRMQQEISKVREDPRSLTLVSHGLFELLVNALIKSRCKNGKKITKDHRGYPHSTKLIILHEIDAIDDYHFKIYNWFRDIRNDAAHEPLFSISMVDFKKIDVKSELTPRNYARICENIVFGFWNKHKDVFIPIFMNEG